MSALIQATDKFGWTQLNVTAGKIQALTAMLEAEKVAYIFGSKADPISQDGSHFVGSMGHGVDCSGYVTYIVYHATAASGCALSLPDGSANIHEWLIHACFKQTTGDSYLDNDGVIRMGVLPPVRSKDGIGHIFFVINGVTYESHGSKGPDSRNLAPLPWHTLCDYYVLNIGDSHYAD